MPFSTIATCIVCEIVQPEGSKYSILDFHGITPDMRIGVKGFPGILDFLSFVLIGVRGEGVGTFDIAWSILSPENQVTWSSGFKGMTINANPEAKFNLMIRAENADVPSPGTYRFNLLVNNQLYYETRFSVVLREQTDDDHSHSGSAASPVVQ